MNNYLLQYNQLIIRNIIQITDNKQRFQSDSSVIAFIKRIEDYAKKNSKIN
ncbi:hypothetical protein BB561_000542 [Smittium simulii]|uniref:Uncharacterized protein n=1 Tax=Smittium simulii TaxID=133385 RepID=A0A2T9YYT5_9FUNG|nr:hypothetical protein BB561_000542 [Smittium simulii]